MNRFFVVSTDTLTPQQEAQLVEYAKNFYWWHWLPNFWLLKDNSETFTIDAIRDQFAVIAPYARCVVLQVTPVAWTGRVREDALGNKMEDWVNSQWKLP